MTYARRAAGIAAVETLNGKKADNSKWTMRGKQLSELWFFFSVGCCGF